MYKMRDESIYEEYEEYEGLTSTSGSGFSLMCFPLSISAACCVRRDVTTATTIKLSKIILTPEETKHYQTPWEAQQKKFSKKKKLSRNVCFCWCCMCTCLCNPMKNRVRRRISTSVEKRANYYKQLIEMTKPTMTQMHDWGTDFEALVNDDAGRKLFDIFLQQEHSDENLHFWLAVGELRNIENVEERRSKMRKIYMEYLKPMSSKEVNISGTTRRKIEEDLQKEPLDTVFDAAQTQVFQMMHRQSYPRFLTSDLYSAVVQSSFVNAGVSTSTPRPVQS